jgi:hypothetical protein
VIHEIPDFNRPSHDGPRPPTPFLETTAGGWTLRGLFLGGIAMLVAAGLFASAPTPQMTERVEARAKAHAVRSAACECPPHSCPSEAPCPCDTTNPTPK